MDSPGNAVIGLVSPGAMGSAVAACLRSAGHTVLWASDGRGGDSLARARDAGLTDMKTMDSLVEQSEIVLSVVPPHAALDIARCTRGARVYVDANAVGPKTAQDVANIVTANGAAYVDGRIIGSPPVRPGTTRLYLYGEEAESFARLFDGTNLTAVAMGASQHVVLDRTVTAGWSAATKSWHWVGEMDEIAATFESAGLPGGFHQAAAEVFARVPRNASAPRDETTLDHVVTTLATSE